MMVIGAGVLSSTSLMINPSTSIQIPDVTDWTAAAEFILPLQTSQQRLALEVIQMGQRVTVLA
jgi:hypothetical protein